MKSVAFISGYQLKAVREVNGWTQQGLADKAGVHVQTVKFWESQDRQDEGGLHSKAAWKMARAMKLEPMPIEDDCSDDELADMAAKFGLSRLFKTKAPDTPRHCNARCPDGRKCRKRPVPGKQRCKQHGGNSTGPTTERGRLAIGQVQKRRWQAYRLNNLGTTETISVMASIIPPPVPVSSTHPSQHFRSILANKGGEGGG